uniref:Qnr n=1 Tax=Stenotrophomonas maltophilia TaxID=40324 RepID=B5T009_STEMA|nr:Qnr [Stenotrophomonas maltophilia]
MESLMSPTVHRELRIGADQYTDQKVVDQQFHKCDFSGADLTGTEFINCSFYDADSRAGCRFNGATLKEASFRSCDISMCHFNFINALGLEISECRAQGADFSNASFMNQITTRSWFCSAFIKKSNLRYANFSRVTLEKCELWENRWDGANVSGASFAGSDLSGGQFEGIDWNSANFTDCDLTNSELGELDLRRTNLRGATLDVQQVALLMQRIGITVVP